MGVYIKGMEMPNNCAECPLNHDAECAVKNCMVTDDCYVRRASWCPLVHVPPHGRWNNIIHGIIPSGQCSNCGAWDKVTRFCPNCGSQMEGET